MCFFSRGIDMEKRAVVVVEERLLGGVESSWSLWNVWPLVGGEEFKYLNHCALLSTTLGPTY